MESNQRFWSKVDRSGDCWIWLAGKDRKGYGKFSVGNSKDEAGNRRNSMVSAHRYAYEMAHGAIPHHEGFHGMCVLHRCDNPSCVNPDHLFLGTNEDNVHDMDRKNRRVNGQLKGSMSSRAILDEKQVAEIVNKRNAGVSGRRVADEYGVSAATISAIMKGRNWRHLGLV